MRDLKASLTTYRSQTAPLPTPLAPSKNSSALLPFSFCHPERAVTCQRTRRAAAGWRQRAPWSGVPRPEGMHGEEGTKTRRRTGILHKAHSALKTTALLGPSRPGIAAQSDLEGFRCAGSRGEVRLMPQGLGTAWFAAGACS